MMRSNPNHFLVVFCKSCCCCGSYLFGYQYWIKVWSISYYVTILEANVVVVVIVVIIVVVAIVLVVVVIVTI